MTAIRIHAIAVFSVLFSVPVRGEELFDWIDSLGFEIPPDAPFVEVDMNISITVDGERFPVLNRGFLIEREGNECRIFGSNLAEWRFTAADAGESRVLPNTHRYEEADLETYLEQVLRREGDETVRHHVWRASELEGGSARFVALSWIAHHRGLSDLSEELRSRAELTDSAFMVKMGREQFWRTFFDFGDSNVPYSTLRNELVKLTTLYPRHEYTERARGMIAILEEMQVRTEENPILTAEEISSLPKEEQIAEWIRGLQNQDGGMAGIPGEDYIFSKPGDGSTTPALALLEFGFEAIPQLIAALDDRSYTRALKYGENLYRGARVLRVGDLAHRIIGEISGERFGYPYWEETENKWVTTPQQVKEEALAWWKQIEEMGEEAFLVESVEAGSSARALRLTKKYPARAFDAICDGIENTEDEKTRKWFYEALSRIPNDTIAVQSALLGYLEEEECLPNKVHIASLLQFNPKTRERADAVLREVWMQRDVWREKSDLEPVAQYLLRSNNPDSIALLSDGYDKYPEEIRGLLVRLYGSFSRDRDALPKDRAGEVAKAVETLGNVIRKDDRPQTGLVLTRNGNKFRNPKRGDLALDAMARIWPGKYDSVFGVEERIVRGPSVTVSF